MKSLNNYTIKKLGMTRHELSPFFFCISIEWYFYYFFISLFSYIIYTYTAFIGIHLIGTKF